MPHAERALILQRLAAQGTIPEAMVQRAPQDAAAAGVSEDTWLEAAVAVLGLPAAHPEDLLVSTSALVAVLNTANLDLEVCRRLQAAPYLRQGQLHVAYENGTSVLNLPRGAFPPHTVTLSTPTRIRGWLQALSSLQSQRTMPLQVLTAGGVRDGEGPSGMGLTRPALSPAPQTPREAVQALLPSSSAFTGRRTAWTLGEVLGAGAAADVYIATNESGQKAAFKQLRLGANVEHLQETLLRFEREANLVERLAHVNVVRLYDRGLDDNGHPWIASEFVDGGSVEALLHKTGAMPPVLGMRIIADILRGLEAAHGLGVVHRDLKPANLLLTARGTCKVADFGVAKVDDDLLETANGVTYGSPAYMSPEQAQGRPIDGRSDLFAVGTICVELLTGRNPFDRFHIQESLRAVCAADPGPLFAAMPGLPPGVEDVIRRLLAVDREERFASATEALEALQPFVDWIETHESNVVRRALSSPKETIRELRHRQARLLERQAKAALQQRPPRRHEAALALGDAVSLDPADDDLRHQAEALVDMHVFALESRLRGLPADIDAITPDERRPELLKRAALAHFELGNVREARFYLRRALQLGGRQDEVLLSRLRALQGDLALAPYAAPRSIQNAEQIDVFVRTPDIETERVVRKLDASRMSTKTIVAAPTPSRFGMAFVAAAVLAVTTTGAYLLGERAARPEQGTQVMDSRNAEAQILLRNGEDALKDGDRDTAVLLLRSAWDKAPRTPAASRAALLEGMVLLQDGRTDAAREAIIRALTGDLSDEDRAEGSALLNQLG